MTTVLITGTSTGIGRLTAITLARRGHRVLATMRTPAKGEAMAKLAADEGLDLRVVALDVNDQESVDRAIGEAGPIDVLVNNAGVEVKGAIEEITDALARDQFETNVFGLLRLLRAVLPQMRERNAGVIVNIGSIAGVVTRPYSGIYAASKHAVSAITESLHYELDSFGVRVHVVEPGHFESELLANAQHASGPNSPYQGDSDRLDSAMTRIMTGGAPADPQAVADRIADIIDDPDAKVHQPVGDDADMIIAVRATTDFEGFEATMRSTLDWPRTRG